MNKIEDSSVVMMSDVLRDNVSEVDNEVEQFSDRFIVVTLLVNTGDSIQPIVGSNIFYSLSNDEYELGVRVYVIDAFDLSGVWEKIKLEGFELELGKESIKFDGPLKIKSLQVKDIDPERQMCALVVKLCKE